MHQIQKYSKIVIITRFIRVFSFRAVLSGFFYAHTIRALIVLFAKFGAVLFVFRLFILFTVQYYGTQKSANMDLFIRATFQTIYK